MLSGPTASEKISCDASSGADEASGYRREVFRADGRKQLKESVLGARGVRTHAYTVRFSSSALPASETKKI